ncbi:MAG TPA: hypothetical protein VGL02_32200 [Streptomyces sp.]
MVPGSVIVSVILGPLVLFLAATAIGEVLDRQAKRKQRRTAPTAPTEDGA